MLDELDRICGGIAVTVVETHGLDDIHLLNEARGFPEVAVSDRSSGNTLVAVIMESNELEYESLVHRTNMTSWE